MSLGGHLAWPGALPILLLVPVVFLLLLALDHARARRARRAFGPRAPVLAAELSQGRRRTKRALFVAALLLALFAVLQPSWGEGAAGEPRGVDIVVCLDVSRSMLARDLEPSRLVRARREIRALAERAAGDRLGLVVFAGEARLAVPLTRDLRSFAELSDLAGPLSVPRGGTDLGAALRTALTTLEGRSGEPGVVLLLTDGDDSGGRGAIAAEASRERDTIVHCVGFGSSLGAKIPVEAGRGEEFLRDRAGREVVSALDAASLEKIAEVTGGEFVDTGAGPGQLVALYERSILPMARELTEDGEREKRENRFQWPLLLAILLWTLDLGVSERRS
ncbi:MAG: VWA domain-containing protein [Planctomycetota bacterium]|jgi:Ca-activated chloride channel family protein